MKCFMLFLIVGGVGYLAPSQASVLKDGTKFSGLERDQRQIKTGEVDLKMLGVQGNAAGLMNADVVAAAANVLANPNNSAGMGTLAAMQMPVNQLALNPAANMQQARYQQFASMGQPGFLPATNYQLRPMQNVVNPYPTTFEGYPGFNPAYMYGGGGGGGNLYPIGQQMVPNGFAGVPMPPLPQQQQQLSPNLDSFASLNNLVNLANLQGLGAPAAAASLQSPTTLSGYPIMPPPPGYLRSYAPAY